MTSIALQASVALLGPDELYQHQQLLLVEEALQASVDRIASGPATSTSGVAQPPVTDKQLQQQLASVRSQIRDLELMAEEQET
jgi:hypothetical protein